MNALERAIACFDSQSDMARALDVTPMAVTQWKRRGVPAGRCKDIEDATQGRVTRAELRPDIFGDLPKKATAA